MKNIKNLALAKMSGFRHKTVAVPEWEGVKVVLREPSGEAWLRWQEVVKAGADDENVSVSEKAHRNLCADVVLFIDVLTKKSRFVKSTAPSIHACSNRRLT